MPRKRPKLNIYRVAEDETPYLEGGDDEVKSMPYGRTGFEAWERSMEQFNNRIREARGLPPRPKNFNAPVDQNLNVLSQTGVDLGMAVQEMGMLEQTDDEGKPFSITETLSAAWDWYKNSHPAQRAVTMGLGVAGGIFDYKATTEQGRAEAAHMREQGRYVLEKARREAKDVGVEADFQHEENRSKAIGTGLFSGSESFAEGTGIDALLDANRNAAEELMADIIKEGERQKLQFDQAADATEKAAKKKAKFGILKTGATVAGGIAGGGAGATAASKLADIFGK